MRQIIGTHVETVEVKIAAKLPEFFLLLPLMDGCYYGSVQYLA